MTIHALLMMMNGFGYDVFRYFLSFLWQSSVILVSVIVLIRFLRGRKYSVRHGILLTTVFVLPFTPLISQYLMKLSRPIDTISIAPSYQEPMERVAVKSFRSDITSAPDLEYSGNKSTRIVALPPQDINSQKTVEASEIDKVSATKSEKAILKVTDYPWLVLMTMHFAFFVYLMGRIVCSSLRIDTWIRRGQPVIDSHINGIFAQAGKDVGVQRRYNLVKSKDAVSPMTVGLLDTFVVIPERLMAPEYVSSMRSVAVHEMAHVARLDALSLMTVSVLRALFFFQPLLWLASRQISLFAEHACDERVVELERKPYSYARMLTDLAENLPTHVPETELAVGFFFTRSQFSQRIKSICMSRHRILAPMDGKIKMTLAIYSLVVMVFLVSLPLGELGALEDVREISGFLVQKGQAVAGADIYLSDPVRGTFELLGETRDDGSFAFVIPDYSYMGSLGVDPAVVALKDGLGFSWCATNGLDGLDAVYIEMNYEQTLTGSVIDEEGKPITGAEIEVLGLGIMKYSQQFIRINGGLQDYITTTDRNGTFTIHSLPQDGNALIAIEKKGYAYQIKPLESFSSGISVALEKECVIRGTVLESKTGKGVGGAHVFVKDMGYMPHRFNSRTPAVTRNDGSFEITGLAENEYSVYAFSYDNHSRSGVGVTRNVIVKAGEEIDDIEIVMTKGGIVTGQVLEADTDIPVARHPVMAHDLFYRDTSSEIAMDITDENGRFSFRLPEGGMTLATMYPAGYLQPSWWKLGRMRNDFRAKVEIEIEEGNTITVNDFVFPKGLILRATLTNPDGDPVGGVSVETTEDFDSRFYLTNDLGQFRISGLARGKKLMMIARHEGQHLRGMYEYEMTESKAVDFVMDTYEVTSLKGTVKNNFDEKVPGASVNLHWFGDGKDLRKAGLQETKTADENGDFAFDEVIVGDKYYIMVNAEGHVEDIQFHPEKMFEAEKSDMTADDIVLDKKGDRWIEGRIVNQHGEPVVGAMLIHNFKSRSNTLTDGNFRIDGLSHVCENISFNHPEYGQYYFPYLKTNMHHELVFVKGAHYLSGRIVDENGDLIENASINAIPHYHETGKDRDYSRMIKKGVFRLSGLIEDEVDISVYWPEHGFKTFRNQHTDRDEITLVFDMPDERKEPEWEFNPDQSVVSNGGPAPELQASGWLSGTERNLERLKGSIVALHFRRLKPTMSEQCKYLRYLQSMQDEYGPKGVVVIGVHPSNTDIGMLESEIKRLSITIPTMIDEASNTSISPGRTFDAYGMSSNNYSVLIARDGTILHDKLRLAELEERIQKMLQ